MRKSNDDNHLTLPWRWSPAIRIVAAYSTIAIVWIIASDVVVSTLFSNDVASILLSLKGVLFVVFTAPLLYWIVVKAYKRERELGERLRHAIDASRDGIWHWDLSSDTISMTPGGDAELGWDAANAIKNIAGWQASTHPDDWQKVANQINALNEGGADNWHVEQRFKTVDGGWHWMEINGQVTSRTPDGTIHILEGTYHSIDGLKNTQLALERKNGALKILVAAYDAVSSGRSRQECLQLLVEAIAAADDCPVAWIGKAINDDEKSIQPLNWAGPASGFPQTAIFRWDNGIYGMGPAGTCVKTGRPSLFHDIQSDVVDASSKDSFVKYGIRSAVAIPITVADGDIFVLHITANTPQQFSEDDNETYGMVAKILRVMLDTADITFQFNQSESARLQVANRLQKAMSGAVAALATVVEKRDPYTAGHQQRVAEFAVAIGKELGLSDDRIEGLRIGAWIHDIGKIGVPTEILSKPGRLDHTEIALIQRHAEIGYDIVKNINFGWPVEKIVHQHHERIDGTGYPQGLKGDQIQLEPRIVAVADVIESMATDRPYRKSIPWNAVIDEITNGRGAKYDINVVNAAMRVLDQSAASFGFNTSSMS